MQLESLKAEQGSSFQMGFDRSLKLERCSVHSLFDPVTVGVVSSSSSPSFSLSCSLSFSCLSCRSRRASLSSSPNRRRAI